jgi:hypothetical protein
MIDAPKPPNLRLNALKLGVLLICAAASPWSGLSRQAAREAQWQPEYPFGLPRWFPHKAVKKLVSLDKLTLMRSVLRLGKP